MSCLCHFKAGRTVMVSLYLRFLGLMAAASPVSHLGLLHVRPFQWWTKIQRISLCCHPHRMILVTWRCVLMLTIWTSSKFIRKGVRLGACFRRETVTPELRSRHALETEPGVRGMEAAPSNSELHMASVWRSGHNSRRARLHIARYGSPYPPHRPWDWTL